MKFLKLATTAIISAGLVAVPLTAFAIESPTVPDEFCTATYSTVNHEAAGEPNIPNPAYIPAIPGTPEVPAVTHTEYEFVHRHGQLRWESNANWNANDNPHSTGWTATGNTRIVVDVPGTPATPETPAVGTPTIPNPDYVAAYTEQVQGEDRCDLWVTWTDPDSGEPVGWDQPFLGFGKITPACNTDAQQDHYVGYRSVIDAILSDSWLRLVNGTPEDSQVVTEWILVDGGICEPEPPVITYVTPLPPTVTDQCGTENDRLNLPTDVPGVQYTSIPATSATETLYRVTARITLPNHEFAATPTYWELVTSNVDCTLPPTDTPEPPTVARPTPPVAELAETGLDPVGSWSLILALLLLVGGGSLLAYRARKSA